jgi:hypothetical protein
MKDLNIVVDCKNKEQALDVINTFKNMGYEQRESIDGDLIVRVMGGYVFDMSWNPGGYDERMNYESFEYKFKPNKMIELINKAKLDLKMNYSELSLALGKSRQYIGKMLRLPQSKKVQDKVIKEINEFMDKAKNPVGECKDVTIGNIEIVNPSDGLAGAILNHTAMLSNKDKEISDLKKANEQQKLVIDKLDDQLIKAEKIHNEDVKAIELKDKEIKYLNERRIEYKEASIKKQRLVDSLTKENGLLTGELEHSRRETDHLVNQFKRVEDELKELKSSHTTSKALNWFFVVAIILAAIVWKAYNG